MDLPFFAADTLGVTLFQTHGVLKADEARPINLGGWRVPLLFEVRSDILSGQNLGFWVTVGALRMYLIVRNDESWLFVLNAEALKVVGEKTSFAGNTTKERVLEFKSAIVGLFQWKKESSVWTRVEYDSAGV